MNMNPGIRLLVVTGLVAGLFACGGGGGGGSSSASPTAPEAPSAGDLVDDTSGLGTRAAPMNSLADLEASSVVFADIQTIEAFVDTISNAVSTQMTSFDYVSASGLAPCSIDSENLSLIENIAEDGTGRRAIEFTNCVLNVDGMDYSLDGSVVSTITRAGDGEVLVRDVYDLAGIEFNADNAPVSLVGSQATRVEVSASKIIVTATTPVLEFTRQGRYVAIRGSVIEITEMNNQIHLYINSQIIGSAIDGYLNLKIPYSDKVIANVGATCPSSGRLSVIGDGRIDSAFGSSNNRGSGVEVFVNGVEARYDPICSTGVPGVSDNLSATVNATSGAPIRALAE
ncbi:MAG TPA: hypothetical protein VFM78_05165 [Marinobacter sp.]|nr:hypothetical protein [Marinobacter sp.]